MIINNPVRQRLGIVIQQVPFSQQALSNNIIIVGEFKFEVQQLVKCSF